MYVWLAGLVVVVHLLVVIVLLLGTVAFITGRFSRLRLTWRIVILTTFGGYVTSQALLQDCILTRVEKHLKMLRKAGPAYRGSFFDNYFPFVAKITDRYGAQIAAIVGLMLIAIVLRASYLRWIKTTRLSKSI